MADLKFQYLETHDFFFYSLYAQYYLIKKHFKTSSLSTMSDGAEGSEVYLIRLNIERYLESIYTWGRFELTLFANCLFYLVTSIFGFNTEKLLSICVSL